MRRLRFLVMTGLAAALTLFAHVSAASACAVFIYEPELPPELRR
ncbi:MAG: cyclic lactone autoinducer peptide [Thermoanaerobacterales bacterium]|nr:cyclic lactone autoinducer peptide [Bacillota bacterium]MDI6907593.1 cyclic lactone autoinducer peptide [Thermoanaerobacterales bacterium]